MSRSQRSSRIVLASGALVAVLAAGCGGGDAAEPREAAPPPAAADGVAGPAIARGLDGEPVDPLASAREEPGVEAVALVFTDPECPISNRLAPELRKIGEEYSEKVRFWLVYPDPTVTPEQAAQHGEDFDYPFPALRDPEYALVERTGVSVYSEVAVLDPDGELLYRGRVNDRFVDFGVTRPEAKREDLRDALEAVLAHRPVETPRTRAIGCYIPPHDLVTAAAAGERDEPS